MYENRLSLTIALRSADSEHRA